MNDDEVRVQLLGLIIQSGDVGLSEQGIADAGGSLRSLNYSSMAYMRLIDGIENELGVYVDPEADTEMFESVDSLMLLVRRGMEQAGA